MPFLVGWLVGSSLITHGLVRTLMLMAIWPVSSIIARQFALANLGQGAAYAAVVAAPLLLLAYALHRPHSSWMKLRLIESLLLWCRWSLIWSVVVIAFKLYGAGFALSGIHGAGRWLGYAAVAWAVGGGIQWWLERDRAKAERASLDAS